jgi:hypothetical protein
MRHKAVQVFLYGVIFLCLCLLTEGLNIAHWALAEYGFRTMLAGIAVYAIITFSAILLLNRIHGPFVAPSNGLSAFQDPIMTNYIPTGGLDERAPIVELEHNLVLGTSQHAKILGVIEVDARDGCP